LQSWEARRLLDNMELIACVYEKIISITPGIFIGSSPGAAELDVLNISQGGVTANVRS